MDEVHEIDDSKMIIVLKRGTPPVVTSRALFRIFGEQHGLKF